MEDVFDEDSWMEELPHPDELEWEDIDDQIDEELIERSESDDEEPKGISLTHVPTGLSAIGEEYRTKSENRELARDRMLNKISEQLTELRQDEEVYPESEEWEGFEGDRDEIDDRWTPPEPDNPPWESEEENPDLP